MHINTTRPSSLQMDGDVITRASGQQPQLRLSKRDATTLYSIKWQSLCLITIGDLLEGQGLSPAARRVALTTTASLTVAGRRFFSRSAS